jgi:hypothetical protein
MLAKIRHSVLRVVSGRSHTEARKSGRSGSLTRSVMPMSGCVDAVWPCEHYEFSTSAHTS